MPDIVTLAREVAGIGTKIDLLTRELETWKKAHDRFVETLGVVMEQKDVAERRVQELEAELDERRNVTVDFPINRYKQEGKEIGICPTCWVTRAKPVAVAQVALNEFECQVCLNKFGGSGGSGNVKSLVF